jgi:hypothetical protein
VNEPGRDGFFVAQKVVNGHLPHFVVRTCLTFCENLPLSDKKHLPLTQ